MRAERDEVVGGCVCVGMCANLRRKMRLPACMLSSLITIITCLSLSLCLRGLECMRQRVGLCVLD